MKRRTNVIIGSLLFACLIGWCFNEWGRGPAESSPDENVAGIEQPQPVGTGIEQPQPLSEAEIQRQFEAMEQDRQSGAAELTRRSEDQSRRLRAEAKTEQERIYLQVRRSDDWSKFLQTRLQTYQNLRAKAAASPDGKTPCTLCDGHGSMDWCFLCKGTGICPTCQGTGKLNSYSDELCPTCLGSGKCYLCGGSGKMICPFCDDGVVDSHSPPPPNLLPLVPPPYH